MSFYTSGSSFEEYCSGDGNCKCVITRVEKHCFAGGMCEDPTCAHPLSKHPKGTVENIAASNIISYSSHYLAQLASQLLCYVCE